MPRLTRDQWAAIRLEWEGEPTATLEGLGKKYGVHKSTMSRKADEQGWTRLNQLGTINEAAQRRADSRVDGAGEAQPKRNAAALATRYESETVRADLLVRHRTEWAELESFRRVALAAMKKAHEAGDKATWYVAKLAADTAKSNLQALEIKQSGEARAWGLDAKSEEEIVIKNPRPMDVA